MTDTVGRTDDRRPGDLSAAPAWSNPYVFVGIVVLLVLTSDLF